MARSADTVYRKTPQGQAELAQRSAGLPLRARSVLVMVNGVDSAQRLAERLGPAVLDTLAALREQGLIEALVPVERAARPASPPPVPAAAPAPPSAAPGLDPQHHRAQAQALVQLLLPYFGPDAPRIAESALRATSVDAFNQGLDAVADRLAIHLGRRKAAEAIARLRL